MKLNEIKKILYRKKPDAYFDRIQNGICFYSARTLSHKNSTSYLNYINFEIPVQEMQSTPFYHKMDKRIELLKEYCKTIDINKKEFESWTEDHKRKMMGTYGFAMFAFNHQFKELQRVMIVESDRLLKYLKE